MKRSTGCHDPYTLLFTIKCPITCMASATIPTICRKLGRSSRVSIWLHIIWVSPSCLNPPHVPAFRRSLQTPHRQANPDRDRTLCPPRQDARGRVGVRQRCLVGASRSEDGSAMRFNGELYNQAKDAEDNQCEVYFSYQLRAYS